MEFDRLFCFLLENFASMSKIAALSNIIEVFVYMLCMICIKNANAKLTFVMMRTGAKTIPDSMKAYLSVLAISNPESNVHVLTEKMSPLLRYDFSNTFRNVRVFPLLDNINDYAGKIMLARIQLYREHLCSKIVQESPRTFIFTDDDILIIKDVLKDKAFRHDFDVGFTWDQNESGYINMGVFIVSGEMGKKQKACEMFKKAEQIFLQKHMDKANWLGDQYAIRDAIGGKGFFKNRPVEFCEIINGTSICFFDRGRLNGTPGKTIRIDTCILHYKGKHRKSWQYLDSELYMRGGHKAIMKKYYHLRHSGKRKSP